MNRPIDKKPAQVQRQYNRQTAPAPGTDVPAPRARAKPPAEIPPAPEDFEDDFVKDVEVPAPASTTSGLAAAIARAREIKQEPMRSPADTARHQEGVKKI